MAKLVETLEQIIENVHKLDKYGSGSKKERSFFARKIKNGKNFVCIKKNNKYYFAPSKFAGYLENDISHDDHLNERDGRKTDIAISRLMTLVDDNNYTSIMNSLSDYRNEYSTGASQNAKPHKFWFYDTDGTTHKFDGNATKDTDQYNSNSYFLEGSRIYKEAYVLSRSQNLVSEAKRIHGLNCHACDFNFEDFYGQLGSGFIECHHLVQVSKKGASKVSVSEVCVLCANCHRMVHREDPPISLSDLISRIKRKL